MSDVFSWYMSAAPHRASVEAVRNEIVDSHAASRPLPVGLILDLLPLKTDQGAEIAARGMFEWDGDQFSNQAAEDLFVEFEDPVLKTFSITIPAEWSGTLSLSGDELTLTFEAPLTITIPELANQGVNRSALQNVSLIRLDPSASNTRFVDALEVTRITWIVASLDPAVSFMSAAALESFTSGEDEVTETTRSLRYYRMFSTSNNCGEGDPDNPNWYVYERNGGMCVVHYGEIIYGGELAYRYRFGPATKDKCDRYAQDHCDF